jgi:hypothetical protein
MNAEEKKEIFIIGANNIANINLKYHYWHFGWRYVILGCFIRLLLSFFLFWWILVEPISCKNGNEISRLINQFSEKYTVLKKILLPSLFCYFSFLHINGLIKFYEIGKNRNASLFSYSWILFIFFFVFILSHRGWKQTIKKFIHVRRFLFSLKMRWLWVFVCGWFGDAFFYLKVLYSL